MKAFRQTRSSDALCVHIDGDKRRPEPSTLVVQLPGGHVEVSRCSDGTYWVHVEVVDNANISEGRIQRADRVQAVESMPEASAVTRLAVRIANTVPRFDPDA